MQATTIVIICFMITGLLEIILGIPLYYRKIKRNIFYGFRTKKTLSDDKIWKKSNKKVGKDIIIAGIILALGTLILVFIKDILTIEIITSIGLVLVLLPITIVIIRGFSYLREL